MDSEASISSKRKHRSDIEDPSTGVLAKRPKSLPAIKHINYWYDDGNVVVQVDDTQFKLYRGQLSRHSTYFAELFQEPLTEYCVDGHPCYVIRGTNVEDFVALLNAINDTR